MKLLAIPALALCMLVLVGCADGNAPSPDTTVTISEAKNKVEANIEGMDCTGCSGSVMAAVEGIDGVTACHADVKTGDVKVALAEGADAEATKAEIEKVITGLSEGKYTIKTIAVSTAGHDHPHAEGEVACCGECGGDKSKPCPEGCTKDCCKDKADGEAVTACPEGCTKDCCKATEGSDLIEAVKEEVADVAKDVSSIEIPSLGGE